MASDAELWNNVSHQAHKALGYQETGRVVLFKKDLERSPRTAEYPVGPSEDSLPAPASETSADENGGSSPRSQAQSFDAVATIDIPMQRFYLGAKVARDADEREAVRACPAPPVPAA
jgi:hypothetical protein